MYVQNTQSSTMLSNASARTLPDVKYCDPKVWIDVFGHWRAAVDAVNRINDRLALLKISTNPIGSWNSGPEKTYFGSFRFDHFEQLQKNMRQIRDILRDPKLTIVCDAGLKDFGKSFPGIRRIKLGAAWKAATLLPEKTQTLIHEAAHIAGVLNFPEKPKSGVYCAKLLALRNCFKAMRNADNYGYYALHFIGAYQNAMPSQCAEKFPAREC